MTKSGKEMLVQAGPAQFGPELKNNHRVRKKFMASVMLNLMLMCVGSS
jgi:hypothetical protein